MNPKLYTRFLEPTVAKNRAQNTGIKLVKTSKACSITKIKFKKIRINKKIY